MSAFDLTKTEDSTMSVVLNYLPIGLSEIFRDDANNFITANCALSPSSNVTYTNNNVTTEYKANKMWIVGKANDRKLNAISGIEQDAQLIVRNMNSNGDKIYEVVYTIGEDGYRADFVSENYDAFIYGGSFAFGEGFFIDI